MDQQKDLIPELCCLVAKSYPTLCEPMDCRPPGSSVHEVSQARVLEWVAVAFSRGSSWSRDQTQVSYLAGRFFTTESPGTPIIQESFPERKELNSRSKGDTIYKRKNKINIERFYLLKIWRNNYSESLYKKRNHIHKREKSQTGLGLLQSNNPGQKTVKHDCKGLKDHLRISQSAEPLNNKEMFSNMKIHGI